MTDTSFDIAVARQLAEQAKANAATWSKRSRSQSYVPRLVATLLDACAELEQARNILSQLSPAERHLAEIEAESGLPPIPWREQ